MARRNGEAWNDEDIETLVRMFRAGDNNREIARTLERTVASVSTRISTLKRRRLLGMDREDAD